jgi:predicted ATPase
MKMTREQFRELKEGLGELAGEKGKQRFDRLEPDEQAKLLLRIVRVIPRKIYMLHIFESPLSFEFSKELSEEMKELKESGALIIYLGNANCTLFSVDRYFSTVKEKNRYRYLDAVMGSSEECK